MEALKLANRMDLVGFDKKCLVRPRQDKGNQIRTQQKKEVVKIINELYLGGDRKW